MTNVTDVGAFGEILSKYCGSNITQQFYTFKHNQPMLLTEYEMGSLLFENFLTYLIFLSFITTIKISVSIYKDAFTPTKNKDESDEIKSFKCKTRLYGIGTCVQRFMIVLYIILGIILTIHFFVNLGQYFNYVNRTVKYQYTTNLSFMAVSMIPSNMILVYPVVPKHVMNKWKTIVKIMVILVVMITNSCARN
eukprot:656847_1